MGPRHVVRGAVLAVALVMTVAVPVGAKPENGSVVVAAWAGANLGVGGLWDCAGDAASATLPFLLFDGQLGRWPIAPSLSNHWIDTDPFLELFGCGDDYWEFQGASHDLTDLLATPDRVINGLSGATFHGDVPMYVGENDLTGVRATFDLTWVATGSPSTSVDHPAGYVLRQQTAPASVSGTVVFYGLDSVWPDAPVDTITFVADGNSWDSDLGRATEVLVP
jgi:hypothetical protein